MVVLIAAVVGMVLGMLLHNFQLTKLSPIYPKSGDNSEKLIYHCSRISLSLELLIVILCAILAVLLAGHFV